MITKETCVKIYTAHNEIEKANELLKTLSEKVKSDTGKNYDIKFDHWIGNKEGLKLGVPYGDSGHSLYNISPKLAINVIEEHITSNQKRLEELMVIAKIELAG